MAEFEDPNVHRLIDLATGAYALELESQVTSHPATDTLVAYQEGRLDASQADEVRKHLIACPSCGEELERLEAFDQDPDVDQGGDAPATSSAAWADFRERSAMETGRPIAGSTEASAPPPHPYYLAWQTWALAASVLFILAGSIALFLALQPKTRSREMHATSNNPFVFDLLPNGRDVRRSEVGTEVIDIPKGMDPLVPRLLLGDQTAYPSYSATLTRVSGETLWKQSELRRQPSGGFALLIPRAGIPPGDYVLHLLGDERGAQRELASYTFRLHYLE